MNEFERKLKLGFKKIFAGIYIFEDNDGTLIIRVSSKRDKNAIILEAIEAYATRELARTVKVKETVDIPFKELKRIVRKEKIIYENFF